VLDATRPAALPAELLSRIRPAAAIAAINKVDLAPLSAAPALPRELESVRISALTGAGLEQLVAAIVRRADAFQADVGADAIAVNARHAHALAEARDSLGRAQEKLREAAPIELVASELRAVVAAFGEIVGKVDNERMLDQLFASFCIGK